jgi:hypothetical protein
LLKKRWNTTKKQVRFHLNKRPRQGINIFDKATMTQAKASELYKQANCVPQYVAGFKVP